MSIYELALSIAKEAHNGQVDKAGKAYIEHPLFVASQVTTDYEKATALLHDVVEDSEITLEDLIDQGIPSEVIEAVTVLTKPEDLDYFEYLERVKSNDIARVVKLADLSHNSDLERIQNPVQNDYERLEKYKKAIEYLS